MLLNATAGTTAHFYAYNAAGKVRDFAHGTWDTFAAADYADYRGTATEIDTNAAVFLIRPPAGTVRVELRTTGETLVLSTVLASATIKYNYDDSAGWGGRVWYVDGTNGNDAWCGNEEEPLATITAAEAARAEGDTTRIANGTYVETVTIAKRGKYIGQSSVNTIISPEADYAFYFDAGSDGSEAQHLKVVGAGTGTKPGLKFGANRLRLIDIDAHGVGDGSHGGTNYSYLSQIRCTCDDGYDGANWEGTHDTVIEDSTFNSTAAIAGAIVSALRIGAAERVVLRRCSMTTAKTANNNGTAVGLLVSGTSTNPDHILNLAIEDCNITVSSAHASATGAVAGIRQFDESISPNGKLLLSRTKIATSRANAGTNNSIKTFGLLLIDDAAIFDRSEVVSTPIVNLSEAAAFKEMSAGLLADCTTTRLRFDEQALQNYASIQVYVTSRIAVLVNGERANVVAAGTVLNESEEFLYDYLDIEPTLTAAPAAGDIVVLLHPDLGINQMATTDLIREDTEDIQSRVPTALVGGKMSSDSTVTLDETDTQAIADAIAANRGWTDRLLNNE